MNLKLFLITALSLLVATGAYASNYKRQFQDAKFPTQKMIEAQSFTDVPALSSTAIATGLAGNTSAAAATITSGLTNPSIPRNIYIVPTGSTGDVASCNVVVNGTNILNGSMSETFHLSANQSTMALGSKAFKTVSSVVFPALCEDAPYQATFNVGASTSVGLSRCLDNAGDILFSLLNGAKEATAPTMAVNASTVESNTAIFNGTLNGSNDFKLYFMQNYRCTP